MQAGSPDDVSHIRPDGTRLMGEHNDLDAVVRHALGHPPVGGHHAATEVFVFALEWQATTTVPNPVGKLRWRVLPKPGDEELENLLDTSPRPHTEGQ